MKVKRRMEPFRVILLTVCLLWPALAGSAERLASYTVDLAQSSVSGLSSGAYMAGQFHIAFSGTVMGAGIVAGGPYFCAQAKLTQALNKCMQNDSGLPSRDEIWRHAEGLEESGKIDSLANLADDRIYLFSGTEDNVVTGNVVNETAALYRMAGMDTSAIKLVDGLPAGHGFVTKDQGASCGATESPFIVDCDYDQAGDILAHLYGPLAPASESPGGQMIAFDQSEFLANPTRHGLSETGYIYLPADCAAGGACRVHIVFHGCRQTTDLIGDRFRTETGYRRWADSNRLILLFPETHATLTNPNSCWDWWGYDSPDYETKSGRQMAAVYGMLLRLAGAQPPENTCPGHTAANWQHWTENRAVICYWWQFCSRGAGDIMGLAFATTTLFAHPDGHFSLQDCGT